MGKGGGRDGFWLPPRREMRRALTGVEDGGVDPALRVAHGHLAAGVGEEDFGAARPGRGRHAVGVVAAPVAHQHAVVVARVELRHGGGQAFDFPTMADD